MAQHEEHEHHGKMREHEEGRHEKSSGESRSSEHRERVRHGEHEAEDLGVKVTHETSDKQWRENYRASDLEVVYRRTNPKNWQDMVNWLKKYGESDNELTPGETIAMTEDIEHAAKSGVPFISNPDEAYKRIHGKGREHEGKERERH